MIEGTEEVMEHVRKMCEIKPSEEHEFARDLIVTWLDRFHISQLQKMRKWITKYLSSNQIQDRWFGFASKLDNPDDIAFKRAREVWWGEGVESANMILRNRIMALENLNLTMHPHYDKRYDRKKQGGGVADSDAPLPERG